MAIKSKVNAYIVKGDITEMEVDCIVNAANSTLLGGGGVDGAIHAKAGEGLLEECKTLGGCKTSEAKITKGYNLKAKYIIHTVGPVYTRSAQNAKDLRNCYFNCLELAKKHNIHSIAFPSISTGIYGYPLSEAVNIAVGMVELWSIFNSNYALDIYFVCYDDKTYEAYQNFYKFYN